MILGFPVKGRPVTYKELDAPKQYWMTRWRDSILDDENRKTMYKDGVVLYRLRTQYGQKPKVQLPQDTTVYTRAYLIYIIGAILFPSSSRYTLHPR